MAENDGTNISSTAGLPLQRIAIIIAGQLRSSNLTWERTVQKPRMFGPGDPPTPAHTIKEWLFKVLISQGFAIDVFMYLSSDYERGQNQSDWNGDPETYRPAPGDLRACDLYADPGIFNTSSTHHFYCLVEREVQLLDPFVANNPIWHGYSYKSPVMREQALQQLYGHYRANLVAKQFALTQSFDYTYKVRLRPDGALTQPFPVISRHLTFVVPPHLSQWCAGLTKVVYHSKVFEPRQRWEDMFNFGRVEEMDHLLDRYMDLIADFALNKPMGSQENYLRELMKIKYKTCLADAPSIWHVPVRELQRCQGWFGCVSAKPRPLDLRFDWKELSGKVDLEKSATDSDGNSTHPRR